MEDLRGIVDMNAQVRGRFALDPTSAIQAERSMNSRRKPGRCAKWASLDYKRKKSMFDATALRS